MVSCPTPNRWLVAISGLLAIMALSVAMAVMFPYVDLNAQAQAAAEAASQSTVQASSSEGEGGLRGSAGGSSVEVEGAIVGGMEVDESAATAAAGVLADDAPSSSAYVADVDVPSGASEEVGKEDNKDTEEVITSEESSSASVASSTVESNGNPAFVSESSTVAEESSSTSVASSTFESNSNPAFVSESSAVDVDEETVPAAGSVVEEVAESAVDAVVGNGATAAEEDAAPVSEPVSLTTSEGEHSASTSGNEEYLNANTNAAAATEEVHHSLPWSTNGASSASATSTTTAVGEASSAPSKTGNEVIKRQCSSLLRLGNVNFSGEVSNNNIMDAGEYTKFLTNLINAMPSVEGPLATNFEGLPEELKLNFAHLSCVCPSNGSSLTDWCCSETKGVYLGEDLEDGLDRICEETLGVLENVLG